MISTAFFKRLENYLIKQGVEIQYSHNGQKLTGEDYERMFDLIYLFALSTSLMNEKDVNLGRWAKMNFTSINPMVATEKKINEINAMKNSLLPMDEEDAVNVLLDKKICRVL